MADIENGGNPPHLVENIRDEDELLPPIYYAVLSNDVEQVRLLLRNGADVNLRGHAGNSPLLRCCIRSVTSDTREIFHLLLENGADVNARNSYGWTALHVARCPSMVKELLERGADVNARDNNGITPLDMRCATARRNLSTSNPIVTELLHWGAEIDKRNERVVFQLLLDNACSVESVRRAFEGTGYVDTRDLRMRTPLHCAVRTGRVELVRVLLACGASVGARDRYGCTPLHTAAAFVDCGVEVVSVLIREGADKDARNNAMMSPLHLAFHQVNEAVVEFLLSAGADPDVLQIRTPFFHPCTPLLLKHSVLRNYDSRIEFLESAQWRENSFTCKQCISEIEDMRRTRLSKDLTLYDVAFGDKWDITCARKVYESMSSGGFPMYSEMVLLKLAPKVKKHLSDHANNNSLFVHGLAKKSSFRTNQQVLLEIVKYLSDEDCLNLYIAGC